ncbi:LOW QUALITY PROTEIN: nucleolar MIF4G domain-containing protein 1 [Oenanthe melanoleuca]|uniref:LOW QUALITY PROTEIN: nucleolar MIF4G domain-containing protein 1 n=1 Tax=Oenanthe melanoleuca TaxID=2939378 RepID=UPI0024C1BC54|nr:LOW QUALITY PROTEIN: nucleolar MIF4G domain-containing protein 1 [Oenanthe melanoleuca]
MAAPRRGVAAGRMKRGAAARARRGGKLDRLRQAVQDYVQAAGDQPPLALLNDSERYNRRSRREARKEKRRLKRSRRRRLQRGELVEELVEASTVPAKATPDKPGQPKPAVAKPGQAKPAPAKPGQAKAAPAARPGAPAPPAAGKQRPRPVSAPTSAALEAHSAAAATSARKRALLEANEEEEKEIRRLERQLGLGKRRKKKQEGAAAERLPQSFLRDGLGYVLGALGTRAGLSQLCESSDEEQQDTQPGPRERPPPKDEDGEDEEDEEEDGEDQEAQEDASDPSEADDGEGLWESESSSPEDGGVPEASEPSSEEEEEEAESDNHGATKYVPPQIRKAQEALDDKKREELGRLKKMVNGLINRLSEPNLSSISGQMEELYMANSRKDMNDTLTDILMNACVTPVAMPTRLLMEHVLLVSILHHNVGIEVGAHFLEAVVKKFDELCKSDAEGKECENLLALIAHLYNFHVVHCLLIFDILKKLVSAFTEKEIELILFLLKNVGFSLRKDDALALKELITEAQRKASTAEKKFQDQTRVRFMLETMLALRNNDMRKIPGYDPEPVERLRKLQRALVHSSGSGKDTQLRVSLESLLSADQAGRWWIVGSSWSGAPMISDTKSQTQQKLHVGKVSSKIMELARKLRMNTDIRRSIFCVLMMSEDFMDAFEKLLKLGLKDQQEREIVHVIIYCCLQEKTFNPFYAFLANKFCGHERRFQVTFQFSIWDKIRGLENLSAAAVSNLVSLLAHLIRTKSLPLSVLKVIEFSELDKPKVRFLRQVLSTLLTKADEEEITDIFVRISDNPKLGMLREGLKLFLTHFLLKHAQAQKSAEEASLLKERVELATKALEAKEPKLKL